MSRFTYTAAMLEFLRATYPEASLDDTTRLFNYAFGCTKTAAQLKAACNNHKIHCGRKQGELTRGRLLSVSKQQFEWVKRHYPLMPLVQLTGEFNRTFGSDKTVQQLRSLTKNHRIKSGRTGHFSKGQTSWNAGKKGWQAGGNAPKTQFKKGQIPLNHRPVGSERTDKDGFVMVKVTEPRTWRLKHIIEWEKHHGPVPDDHKIWFIDNDRSHCDISNLMLVTTAEHAIVNKMGLGRAHAEAKQTVVLLARIKMATNKRKQEIRP